ncbi:Aste57867_1905 [Aphanomyces stellatus]|uniref:Aste57867_1905 protein n=1 Tax=Aphanomyces stellatus TaxID=120398 RepID=A0A485K685_9STRA|nr:hypothetical protein As57867_001903 [Aphanomyces stellatus]VFT79112.1 Aste57867_1905 [Aphanomyces stellatus]
MQAKLRTCSFFETLRILGDANSEIDPREIFASYVAALDDADVVIPSYFSLAETYSIAEAKHLRWVPLFLGTTVLPTSENPHWAFEGFTLGLSCLNRYSYSLVKRNLWRKQRERVNACRQEFLGLPPVTSPEGIMGMLHADDDVTIHIAASQLFAGPNLKLPEDVDASKVNYSGFLFPLGNQAGSSSLQAFIQQANNDIVPVIYISFGSMPTLEPLSLVQLIVQVCQTANCRCNVGVPQIPCPIMMDQFYNAKRMVQLGVALTTIGSKQLTAVTVSKAVTAVLHNEKHVRMRAQEMAKYVTDESAGNLDRLCDQLLSTKGLFA